MSDDTGESITREAAREALRLARAKYVPHPKAIEAAKSIPSYDPPPPDCTPRPGLPPSACSAYHENDDWLPPAFVQNATCACETTPDEPSANAVRQTLQTELANTPEAFKAACREALATYRTSPSSDFFDYEGWVAEHFAPVAYGWHLRAYRSGCCPCGPAPFLDWVAVCALPIPFCKLVEEAIDWFGSCHCTPGRW